MAKEKTNAVTEEEIRKQVEAMPAKQYKVRLRNPSDNPYQLQLCRSPLKRKIVRAGRRGGKTTCSAIMAAEAFLAGKRVLYAAPTIDQVDKFWNEVKWAFDEPIRFRQLYKNETKHVLQGKPIAITDENAWNKKGDRRIRAKTAFNAETLRGDYADLLILDEYQNMDETAWSEVGAPMLIDNNGDVVFIYTPPSLETKSNSKAKDPQHAAKMFKAHVGDPLWLCIHFPSSANPHLSREGLEEVAKNLTALAYRQEILAEDTEEIPGALWTRKILEESRVDQMPCAARRIVVAIDPSGGNMTEVGIMVGAEGEDGQYYVLRDGSMKAARPKDWAQRSVGLYYEYLADRIIGERNYGGDMVEETLRTVDENVSYKDVNASRGKLVRAEPVLALFQQGKMHIVRKASSREFEELETELCSYTAAPGQKSPNRLDAMVWVGIELSGSGALGLLDLFKSGRAEKIMAMPPVMIPPHAGSATVKVSGATTVASVTTNDQTPACPKCQAIIIQMVAGQLRCGQCAHQWIPGKPATEKPLGGRAIYFQK